MQADPGMAVLIVVIGEEGIAEFACFFQGCEAARKDGAVLEGLECRLRIGVVVGHVRAGMAAGDLQVGQQVADVFEVIEVPLSAWMYHGLAPPLAMIALRMNSSASMPVSVMCTSQRMTLREKMSSITYKSK